MILPLLQIVGDINNPLSNGSYGDFQTGVVPFLTNIIRLVFAVGGLYALFNFIIAGYQYMNAAGDTKALEAAWARIWQTLIGVIIMISAFVFAAIIGQLFFGGAENILNPTIYGPGDV